MSVIVPVSPEWVALIARKDAALARLALIAEHDDKPWFFDRAYPVSIPLPLFTGMAAEGVLNIDAGETFYVLGIEAPYTCSGVLSEDSVTPATLTIPETLRPLIFDYTWMIRDSGDDRDWSNIPVPSQVIRTGNTGHNEIMAQKCLPGGTKVTVTINSTFFDASSSATGLEDFGSHSLQFVLSGISVKDGMPW